MAVKNRILLLKEFLEENSDEKKSLTTGEIRKYLEEHGCPVTTQTLRTDIESLRESGYEILQRDLEGMPTRYLWAGREWSIPEIQILVDAVSSSQFITRKKSGELIRKLTKMAGPSAREELQPRIMVSEHIKAQNEQLLYIVQEIQEAIRENKKISFRHYQYDIHKKRIPKQEGSAEKRYTVSPYATIWNSDRYYLVGWSDARKKAAVYRIDRMETPRILERKRVPEPEGFRIQDYTDKIFRMYDGPQEEVTLRCRTAILDQIIDTFGEQVELKNVQKDTFDITVPVSISGTFYAWVFQFVGEMKIIKPAHIVEAYAEYLQEAIDDALGT